MLIQTCYLITIYCFFTYSQHGLAAEQDIYLQLNEDDTEITISTSPMSGLGVIRIEDANISPLASSATATKQVRRPFEQEVDIAAIATQLDPALIHAIITVESRYNPEARSKKGAFGLMQLLPTTAKHYGTQLSDTPQQHILAGAKYLKTLIADFNGNLELALAAYNAGPSTVRKYRNNIPPYEETQKYVPKVMKYYRQYTNQS